MGRVISIKCQCEDRSLMLGVGMGYPRTYQEALNDIRIGKYGEEMKRLANETELVTVDASYRAYCCDGCGHIESKLCFDLYKPNDIESAKKTVVVRQTVDESKVDKTVEEFGEWPLWWPGLFKNGGDYVLLKRYEHTCPICKNVMDLIDVDTIEDMKCPKCGETYKYDGETAMWD